MRTSVKSIVNGALAGNVGVLISYVFLRVLFAVLEKAQGASERERIFTSSFAWLVAFFSLGIVFSTLSGFIAGRIAKRQEIGHAAAASALCLIYSIWITSQSTVWIRILVGAITVAFGVLGGLISVRIKKK